MLAGRDSGEFTSWSRIEERVREEQDTVDACCREAEPDCEACEWRPGIGAQGLAQAYEPIRDSRTDDRDDEVIRARSVHERHARRVLEQDD